MHVRAGRAGEAQGGEGPRPRRHRLHPRHTEQREGGGDLRHPRHGQREVLDSPCPLGAGHLRDSSRARRALLLPRRQAGAVTSRH